MELYLEEGQYLHGAKNSSKLMFHKKKAKDFAIIEELYYTRQIVYLDISNTHGTVSGGRAIPPWSNTQRQKFDKNKLRVKDFALKQEEL